MEHKNVAKVTAANIFVQGLEMLFH